MKKGLWIAMAAAGALCGAAQAAPVSFAEPYVELSLGVATGSDLAFDGASVSVDSGPAASIGFGFAKFTGPVDLRLDYATTDRDTCSVFTCVFGNQGITSGSTMLSALYNFPLGEGRWEAYAGAGAGIVKVDVENTVSGPSGSDNVFGWQLIGGARVRLFDGPIRLLVEYRYQTSQDARFDGHTVEYNSSSFTAGVRWTF
jgi:opacity protein-like surface antigen